jgi:hypothetical protein
LKKSIFYNTSLYLNINKMKKKHIFLSILFVAIAVAAAWNFAQNKNEVELSDLAMENVEALAQGEGGGVCHGTGPGWTDVWCYGGGVICCWAHTDVFYKN